jgi:regulator of RNase E activity RraA
MNVIDDDTERFATVESRLHTPVIGDILDQLGLHHQFLSPRLRPLQPAMRMVGRAMPVLLGDSFGARAQPFGRLTEALDSLRPGEIYLARRSRAECAAWGEILTATAKTLGARGAVIDGYHRDTAAVLAQHWPVFSHGAFGQDAGARTEVVDYRVDVEIDGVGISPGDLVIGDIDGVVVVPRRVEDEVIERALAKVSAESRTRAAIEAGMSSSEAYLRYGVL